MTFSSLDISAFEDLSWVPLPDCTVEKRGGGMATGILSAVHGWRPLAWLGGFDGRLLCLSDSTGISA